MLIKQYGQRRLQELGAHKRRQRQRQLHPGIANAARLITDVIQPTCDVIPTTGAAYHVDETTPGSDHVTRRARGPFQRLTNSRNGHAVSYLPLNDLRGIHFISKLLIQLVMLENLSTK